MSLENYLIQVPAQRSAGLRIISHILENTSFAFQPAAVERGIEVSATSVDWQAIWAYALGPEPELVLTLRLIFLNMRVFGFLIMKIAS